MTKTYGYPKNFAIVDTDGTLHCMMEDGEMKSFVGADKSLPKDEDQHEAYWADDWTDNDEEGFYYDEPSEPGTEPPEDDDPDDCPECNGTGEVWVVIRDQEEAQSCNRCDGTGSVIDTDPEACPGCGCKPGDGITESCYHPGS